jgi:galactokinase
MAGAPADVVVRSPGRVNLIGEHTDHNDGWVLPAAIDRGTDVVARRRPDRLLHVRSASLGVVDEVNLDGLDPQAGPAWARYVRGSAALLLEASIDLPGADLELDGDLPIGGGLSSSASVELGVATALLALAGESMAPTELARLGQRVENEVVGVASGLMDQLAVAWGRRDHALLIDCRSAAVEPVPLPADVRLLVLDSAVPRQLAESGYNDRRAECERALEALRPTRPGIIALRDVSSAEVEAASDRLDPVAFRRARHVATEDERVLVAADALRRGAVAAVGELLVASHASLRDDFEVSVPELDALVDIAISTPGVHGARLTGAGFGGCALALVDAAAVDAAAIEVVARYREATGRPGTAFACAAADGVRVV